MTEEEEERFKKLLEGFETTTEKLLQLLKMALDDLDTIKKAQDILDADIQKVRADIRTLYFVE